MSTVQDIYNEMFEGKTVTVACSDRKEFETLRTALCHKNQLNVALEITDGSVCASYDSNSLAATFKLAPSQRKQAASRWQIISATTEESSGE